MPWLLLALWVVLAAGCGGPTCEREPPLSYDNWGQAYMSTYCTGCHSSLAEGFDRREAPVGLDFNTYGDVLDRMDRIMARSTGDAPTMPPSGGPSPEETAMLEEWLTCTVAPDAAELEAAQ